MVLQFWHKIQFVGHNLLCNFFYVMVSIKRKGISIVAEKWYTTNYDTRKTWSKKLFGSWWRILDHCVAILRSTASCKVKHEGFWATLMRYSMLHYAVQFWTTVFALELFFEFKNFKKYGYRIDLTKLRYWKKVSLSSTSLKFYVNNISKLLSIFHFFMIFYYVRGHFLRWTTQWEYVIVLFSAKIFFFKQLSVFFMRWSN